MLEAAALAVQAMDAKTVTARPLRLLINDRGNVTPRDGARAKTGGSTYATSRISSTSVRETAVYRPPLRIQCRDPEALHSVEMREHTGNKTSNTRPVVRRQGAGTGNVAAGYPACNDVGNDVLSCYPQSGTSLNEDAYSKFIWNANYPVSIGSGNIDVYLFNAGTETSVLQWKNLPNARGSIGFQINDAWFPPRSTWSAGQSATESYFFVVATAGGNPNAGALHQATFAAVQTSPPSTLLASLASAASASAAAIAATATGTDAAAASSIASSLSAQAVLSSLNAAGVVPISTDANGQTIYTTRAGYTGSPSLSNGRLIPTPTPTVPQTSTSSSSRNPSSLQGDGSKNSVPAWAIALIAIFGALALLSALIGMWFCLRSMRRKREERYIAAGEGLTGPRGQSLDTGMVAAADAPASDNGRDSDGRPLMSDRARPISTGSSSAGPYSAIGSGSAGRTSVTPASPLPAVLAGSVAAGGLAGILSRRSITPRSASYSSDDIARGPTTTSREHFLPQKPSIRSIGSSAIAPNDAAIIGDAFRNMMRKPEFPTNDSGSSGENDDGTKTPQATASRLSVDGIRPKSTFGLSTFGESAARGSQAEEKYGDRESDEEDGGKEADELMRHELESEGTSVRTIPERKKPAIQGV